MVRMDDREPVACWVDEETWGRVLDPSLPPGVIALQDTEGQWWRYPLAEFPADEAEVWAAARRDFWRQYLDEAPPVRLPDFRRREPRR
jgi:hypothetical protein